MTHSLCDGPGLDTMGAQRLLVGLVEHYSPSGRERAAASYLVEQMQQLGFRAFIDDAGNAVGELGDGEQTVLLLGHIDTVPGRIDVRLDGDRLYGRGAVDAKGPLAAFVAAAARAGPQRGTRIAVVGAVEEESATSKGARFLLDRESPGAVVIGEPSAWNRITIGYKGRLLVDYELSLEVAHTAGPGASVSERAVAFWQQVARRANTENRGRQHMFDKIIPSLRSINSHGDGFTETVQMTVGLRLPPDIDIGDLRSELLSLADGAQLRFRGYEVAYRASKSNPLARAFIKAIRAQGGRAVFKVKSGTSDMNVVGPIWGCPILAYGPGDSSLDHTPHEHISLCEYHRSVAVLATVLAELARRPRLGSPE